MINRQMRRKLNEKQTLTVEESKKGKTRLQKWAENVASNQEMGKMLDENFQNDLAQRNINIDSAKHYNALSSLEVFYGDKEKAMQAHRQNMKIERQIEEKKRKN